MQKATLFNQCNRCSYHQGERKRLLNQESGVYRSTPPLDVENRYFLELSEQKVRLNLYRLKQSGEFDWQRLGEFKDKSIATLRTNLTGQIAQKYVEAGMIVVPVESLAQGLEMLLRNRVDYWAATDFVLEGLDVTDETRNKLQFADSHK